jgi:GAF domain-containing protein
MDSDDHRHRQPGSGVDGDPISELVADFSDTAQILFTAGSVDDTLAQVADSAVATIEGCDYAGLFLLEKDAVTSPVRTDPVVDQVDALQHASGEGPCLDAIAQSQIFYADDLAEDPRWPHFGPQANAAGIRSVLALPLATNGSPGALNLYARYPAAFGVADRAKGIILASLAGVAVSVARSHEDEERRADNLNSALATRELIGQAQGILMERERITSDQAFDILRRASQHLNRKLRDVAQDLVDTGTRPETGGSDSSSRENQPKTD